MVPLLLFSKFYEFLVTFEHCYSTVRVHFENTLIELRARDLWLPVGLVCFRGCPLYLTWLPQKRGITSASQQIGKPEPRGSFRHINFSVHGPGLLGSYVLIFQVLAKLYWRTNGRTIEIRDESMHLTGTTIRPEAKERGVWDVLGEGEVASGTSLAWRWKQKKKSKYQKWLRSEKALSKTRSEKA